MHNALDSLPPGSESPGEMLECSARGFQSAPCSRPWGTPPGLRAAVSGPVESVAEVNRQGSGALFFRGVRLGRYRDVKERVIEGFPGSPWFSFAVLLSPEPYISTRHPQPYIIHTPSPENLNPQRGGGGGGLDSAWACVLTASLPCCQVVLHPAASCFRCQPGALRRLGRRAVSRLFRVDHGSQRMEFDRNLMHSLASSALGLTEWFLSVLLVIRS